MYIFWCMSAWFLYYLYKARSLFDSSHKTDWSHVNCKTQRQVVVINAVWHTAALNHRQIYPSPLWFLPQWFDLNLSWKKRKTSGENIASANFSFAFFSFFFTFPSPSQWLTFNLINIAWAHWPEQSGRKKTYSWSIRCPLLKKKKEKKKKEGVYVCVWWWEVAWGGEGVP